MTDNDVNEAIDLGSWLGRRQAFDGIAGRCSAADANCLREIREKKKYRATGLTWDEFCPTRLGLSRALADKQIRLLEEFGETYFYLSGITGIQPTEYRLIAGAITDSGVNTGAELIPFNPQNTVRISEAVEALKRQAITEAPARPAKHSKAALARAVDKLQSAVADLERALMDGPGQYDQATLLLVLSGSVQRLGRLDRNLRP